MQIYNKSAVGITAQIKKFYEGKIDSREFVKYYGDTWDELIELLNRMKKIDSPESIPQEFLDKKVEFEQALYEYFENEYCQTTKISVDGGKIISPTIQDVYTAIGYIKQNGLGMGRKAIRSTIAQQIREKNQKSEQDTISLTPMREKSAQCKGLALRLQQMEEHLKELKLRLQGLKAVLEKKDADISQIRVIAEQMSKIAQEIEEQQKIVDELSVERLMGEKELKDMKDEAISEIDKI